MIPRHAVLRVAYAQNASEIAATFELFGATAEQCLKFAKKMLRFPDTHSATLVVDGFKWEYKP